MSIICLDCLLTSILGFLGSTLLALDQPHCSSEHNWVDTQVRSYLLKCIRPKEHKVLFTSARTRTTYLYNSAPEQLDVPPCTDDHQLGQNSCMKLYSGQAPISGSSHAFTLTSLNWFRLMLSVNVAPSPWCMHSSLSWCYLPTYWCFHILQWLHGVHPDLCCVPL